MGSCGEGRAGPFTYPVQDFGLNRATPGANHLFRVIPIHLTFKPFFYPPLANFVSRQALLVVCIQIHHRNPGGLPLFLRSRVHPCKHRQLPAPRGSCHPPLSSQKVCSPRNPPDVICAQLYRVTPHRSPPGPVPRRTHGPQSSAKGTASCVFIGPSTSTLTHDLVPLLRLPLIMSVP